MTQFQTTHYTPSITHNPDVFGFKTLMAKLTKLFNSEVPMGYEDEMGFHLGEIPKKIKA